LEIDAAARRLLARFHARATLVILDFMRRLAAYLLVTILALAPASAASKSSRKTSPSRSTSAGRPESPGIARPFPMDPSDPSVFPEVFAESVILCDATTGRVLYEKQPDQPRAVASTQKLMTALIVAEAGDLGARVRCESEDGHCEQTKLGLKDGEVYRRYDLLRILLVKSMNDVARCLARDNAGSIESFATRMNAKAREIGMYRTNFVNPNGLTEPNQYSTARDMARLALFAYRNRILRGIMNQQTLRWTSANGTATMFENTNKLLKYLGLCNGMKTGYTQAAGHCLVASATEGGRHVIAVVLGDKRREAIWVDSYRLLAWGLNQLKNQPQDTGR
jgi:D-alanyl-D-alanine carboxypeptidase (penicillin-binding protein 5/6)